MSRDVIATYLEAEVRCYHCGHVSGLLRRACGMPGGPTFFLDHARGARSVVRRLTELRCARCHGPVYADDPGVRYEYAPADVEHERLRRGRPPRWLVEQRLAEPQAT